MYRAVQALDAFFNGFGIDAWEDGTVPNDQEFPYITYTVSVPEWNQKATMIARVWDRTRSNARIIELADQITHAIGEGMNIPLEGGHLILWPESPLIQILVDGDARSAVINLSVNTYHMPGV